ncbi:Allophanate hydrolase OS=Tsukamurella paurometabola (strain ATCC 8368 / DSM / CCUG 35730 / CIP 100753 / JCM 10117 / KCTC 9821 / NBRC 16120 / NCIMB 702349/ NCTC 13040) OX=521096 GN=Tpau_1595 PE=4 SV=1 [Tsukamurella paurometabola]|uniref:Allophanate hydrolase n=1 Tax=Tsukamurella paurometabola (strain ATCC 8368 / DSM 20162 / CCUG 35730 / CIP 100753 / JCM 10117 / KCTC 9821 / NBRC 16120 / NCIMB 702349 / NCTC 13040) TaxID=521096 RepID=D5UYA9_TSUPD|nr:allophanate hydrolase [Tsukamurella paurometabola]ADG78216.1 allophanate hydrolase [Tsukamurella paurometabola DSM 20162]SUP30712.1 Mandelamide hydrolase [Tsukamurella paurometabola]
MSRIADIYRRIAADDRPEVFVTLRPETDVQADYDAAVAAGGPLAGIILAVKDNVDVAGLPTTAACPGYAYTAERDAAAVAALRAAGAVVIGKTNLDQFATGLVGTRSPYGAVRNAHRPDYVSGGSSSGSAVAVALDYADIAIGTDTAGSGRVPAAFQGVVGIKPTIGAVSTDGVIPACASYDCVSVFARDTDAANRAMAIMGATGPRAWPADAPLAAAPDATVAVPAELPGLNDAWRQAFERVVAQAEQAGLRVTRIDVADFLAAGRLLYGGALVAERYSAVGEYLATAGPDAGVDPIVAGIITAAGELPAYRLATDQQRLRELAERTRSILDGCAGLLVPTAPRHPTIADVAADPVGVNSELGAYATFCNLLDLCAVAVPAGETDDGAPFGISVLAPAGHDAVALDLAARITGAPSPEPWNTEFVGALDLAVFGAHLRGQPLERELTALGARWAGPVATAPEYRLVALDTVPPKPGLVHDPIDGRSIRGELWRISPAALGTFLSRLPAPMTLGAVRLNDERSVVGFSCQASALATARLLHVDHWLDRDAAPRS